VVVCDGFTGKVVLKTTEAVAHAILSWLKLELFRNPVRKLGAKLAEGAFKSIRKKTNYEEYGGMPLLGVNGVCIVRSWSEFAARNQKCHPGCNRVRQTRDKPKNFAGG
jgi:fatty acid/phospholipid biosynthesis enzyme